MRRDYLYSFWNLHLGQFRTAGKYVSIFIAVRSVSTGAVYPVYRIIGTLKIAATSKDFIAHRGNAVRQVYAGDTRTVYKGIGIYGGKAFRQIDLGKVCTVCKCMISYNLRILWNRYLCKSGCSCKCVVPDFCQTGWQCYTG